MKLKFQLIKVHLLYIDVERLQENIYVKGSKSMFVKIYKYEDMIILKGHHFAFKNENNFF